MDEAALERGRQEAENLRRSLTREEAFIKLAGEEPELWHRPFPTGIYSRVLASQWVRREEQTPAEAGYV